MFDHSIPFFFFFLPLYRLIFLLETGISLTLPLKPYEPKYKAIFNHDESDKDYFKTGDLKMKKGEIITILRKEKEGWFGYNENDEYGVVDKAWVDWIESDGGLEPIETQIDDDIVDTVEGDASNNV